MKRRNVTIVVDEDVARWARLQAAEEDTSVSYLVGRMLRAQMERDKGYETARRRFMRLTAKSISSRPYPGRDDLHERSRLR